jgi:hypothetical protein
VSKPIVKCLELLSLVLCVGGLLLAQTPAKPDFSGNWRLNLQKSHLEVPVPDSATFRVEHQEPKFKLTRTFVFGGKNDTISFELTTDGKEYYRKDGNQESWTRMYWQGNSLVLDSKIRINGKDGTNIVTYSLADNGRTFLAVERLRAPKFSHINHWVFDKQ